MFGGRETGNVCLPSNWENSFKTILSDSQNIENLRVSRIVDPDKYQLFVATRVSAGGFVSVPTNTFIDFSQPKQLNILRNHLKEELEKHGEKLMRLDENSNKLVIQIKGKLIANEEEVESIFQAVERIHGISMED